jgi:hypothetical protein
MVQRKNTTEYLFAILDTGSSRSKTLTFAAMGRRQARQPV